jgi:hypothetical protein
MMQRPRRSFQRVRRNRSFLRKKCDDTTHRI